MITVEPMDGQITALSAKIQRLSELTGRETATIVRNAGRDFARAALKATPIAAKTRPVVRVTDKNGNFVCWRKAARPVPNRGRGFAKAGWLKVFQGLGINIFGTRADGKAAEFGEYEARNTGYDALVRLANLVPYIKELDDGSTTNPPNNITAKGLLAASNQIDKQIAKLEAKQRGVWNSP